MVARPMLDWLTRLMRKDGLGGPTLVMLIATVGGGACNFIYQIMMQNLVPRDVSEINTLLSILYIFVVPAGAIQNVLIRYTAKYHAQGRDSSISWLLRRTMVFVLILGTMASIGLMVVLNIPEVSDALMLTSSVPIVLVSLAVLFSLIMPIGMGPLQGLQRFTIYGVNYGGNYLLKLIVGVALVALGLGVSGAIGGVLVGILFGTMFSLFAVRRYILTPGERADSGEIWRFTIPTTVAALGFTILTNVDVILAALLMEKDPANYYTAASVLAKIILFLPGAMAAVMFPKVADLYAQRKETWKVLKTAFGITILISGLATAVFMLFPDFILHLLVPHNPYLVEIAPVMQALAPAMALLGLANLFMLYGLATDGHAYIVILFLSTVVLFSLVGAIVAAGLSFTPQMLAEVMILTGAFIIVLSGLYLFVIEREWRPPRM